MHEEFQRSSQKIRIDRLSRYLYDIYKISQTEYYQIVLKDFALYKTIVNHRATFSKIGGVDYTSHFPPTLSPIPPEPVIDAWRKDYQTMQSEMIFGHSPKFDDLMLKVDEITHDINGLAIK